MDGDLTSPNGIFECTAAAQALHRCMNADIHPCKSDLKTKQMLLYIFCVCVCVPVVCVCARTCVCMCIDRGKVSNR